MRNGSNKKRSGNGALAKRGAADSGADRGGRAGANGAPAEAGRSAKLILLTLVSLAAYAILALGKPTLGAKLGQPAGRDFRARAAFQTADLDGTRLARERARRESPLVFRATQESFSESRTALLSALDEGREAELWESIADEAARKELLDALPVLKRNKVKIDETLVQLQGAALVRVEELSARTLSPDIAAVVRDAAGEEMRTVPETELVLLGPESSQLRQMFQKALADLPEANRASVVSAVASLLSPTVELDKERTVQRSQAAAALQEPVVKKVKRDDWVLAKDEDVTRQHILDLRAEREAYSKSAEGRQLRVQRMAGLAVVLLVLAGIAGFYIVRYRPELLQSRLQQVSFALLTLILVGTAQAFAHFDVSLLLVPVPLVVMVLCLVYDQRFGFTMGALYALLVGLAQGALDMDFVVLMLGAMMAALMTRHVRTRSALIKVGLFTGLGQWAAAWGIGILAFGGDALPLQVWESPLFMRSFYALCNGVLSGFLLSGLLPAIERLFGVTTDIRLLEWSNPNQPLLQRLLVEAPGTYHHSMVVASLAADAAETVGVSALLARVSAYFHDVGKLKKPEYFGENMPKDQKNPHEDLSPLMSRLIITAHPRDGADLAEQYGLPREVRNIILQSHGSTTIKYFWDRAKERSDEGGEPEESEFRYRLPRPGSKEAACVMLADAVESAARSLESPSASKITDLVHEIVMDRLLDGQLNESGLTLTDVEQIEKTLARGLNAFYHNRVAYPGQDEEEDSSEDGQTASSGGQ